MIEGVGLAVDQRARWGPDCRIVVHWVVPVTFRIRGSVKREAIAGVPGVAGPGGHYCRVAESSVPAE